MRTMKEIGEFIARERKRQGITQLQLSQAVNMGRRFIIELESGKPTIQAEKMLKVMNALGIELNLVEPKGV